MKPVVALIGRPNVGKSTLFNRLTRTRDALVADFPGLTRDRLFGTGRIGARSYLVVDTAGIGPEQPAELAEAVERHSLAAAAEAAAVILMVDGRAGLTAEDLNLVDALRRLQRPVFLAVNKTEGMDPELAAAEFHALGLGTPWPISAAHGEGIEALMEAVTAALPATEGDEADTAADQSIRITVLGRPNVGKSTLVNRMVGEERVLTLDSPGTTRDAIEVPFDRDGVSYVLIDTAGVRRKARVEDMVEKFSVVKTLQAIDRAHVVILVIDARETVTDQDASLLGLVLQSGRALVIAVNKWDGLEPDHRQRVRQEIDRKLGFVNYARVHYISALHGTGVGDLFGSIRKAWRSARVSVPTPQLSALLESAVEAHQPPLVRGRRIKLRYAHMGGENPPVIVIHGNQVDEVPDAYRRYLENYYRAALKLEGTPLRIEFRQGENPFAGRRNTLTPRQQAKRRRLMRHVRGR